MSNERGTVRARASVTTDIRHDTVFLPFHYAGEECANRLTEAIVDPTSAMPEFKRTRVTVAPDAAVAAATTGVRGPVCGVGASGHRACGRRGHGIRGRARGIRGHGPGSRVWRVGRGLGSRAGYRSGVPASVSEASEPCGSARASSDASGSGRPAAVAGPNEAHDPAGVSVAGGPIEHEASTPTEEAIHV